MSFDKKNNQQSDAILDAVFQPLLSLEKVKKTNIQQNISNSKLLQITEMITKEEENYKKFELLISNETKKQIEQIKRKEKIFRNKISYL